MFNGFQVFSYLHLFPMKTALLKRMVEFQKSNERYPLENSRFRSIIIIT